MTTTKKLKRSDANKQRPDGSAALIGNRKRRSGNRHISVVGSSLPITHPQKAGTNEQLVYPTDPVTEALSSFSPNKGWEGQAVDDQHSPMNRRVIIKRTDDASTIRKNELRNLATFLYQVAVVRAARDLIDPLQEGLRADNIRAEQNLIFNESERWGIVNQALLPSSKGALPHPAVSSEQAVKAFLLSKPAVIAISHYKTRIKADIAKQAGEISTAAADKAQSLALAGHPNAGELRWKTNRSLARVRG